MSYCKVNGCRFSNSHVTGGHKCGTCGQFGHGQVECKNIYMKDQLNQHLEDILPEYLQCKILNCKYKWSHTVAAHTCRNCDERGHDKTNCPKLSVNVKCPLCKVNNLVTKGILQKSEQFQSETDCCVCMSKKADVYFETCHHVCICTECCEHISPFNAVPSSSYRIISEDYLPNDTCDRAKELFRNLSQANRHYCCIYADMGCCWYIRKINNRLEGFFMHSDNYGQYGPETDDTPYLNQFINGYTSITPNNA